jgi:hypothetical protein
MSRISYKALSDAIDADTADLVGLAPPTGAKMESIPRGIVRGASYGALPASGQGIGVAVALQENIKYSSVTFVSGTTALATGTHQWAALLDVNYKVLAISADSTSAAWGTATAKTFTFGTAYQCAAQQTAYVVLVVAATTTPTIVSGATAILGSLNAVLPFTTGITASGQTTPPAVGATLTLSTSTKAIPYFYLS